MTTYFNSSLASGALFNFLFIDETGTVDQSRSALLVLDRSTSLNHALPFKLFAGEYQVSAYDIEQVGLLQSGVLYPAFTKMASVLNESSQG